MKLKIRDIHNKCSEKEMVELIVLDSTNLNKYYLNYSTNNKKYPLPDVPVNKDEIVYVYTNMGAEQHYTPLGYVKCHDIYLGETSPLLCDRNQVDVFHF